MEPWSNWWGAARYTYVNDCGGCSTGVIEQLPPSAHDVPDNLDCKYPGCTQNFKGNKNTLESLLVFHQLPQPYT